VKSSRRAAHPEGVAVYNFEVEDDHTYFIGNAQGGTWVHNQYPRIHTVAPDWATKGAHITYLDVELSVRPGAGGSIVFKAFFGGGGRAAEKAAADAQQLLQDREFLARLLGRVTEAKSYVLQFAKDGGVGRSAELHFLEKALRRLIGE
jgi:hypothetical protein